MVKENTVSFFQSTLVETLTNLRVIHFRLVDMDTVCVLSPYHFPLRNFPFRRDSGHGRNLPFHVEYLLLYAGSLFIIIMAIQVANPTASDAKVVQFRLSTTKARGFWLPASASASGLLVRVT